MGALIFNKYGIPDDRNDLVGLNSIGQFAINVNHSKDNLIRIFSEAEGRNEVGVFADFVKASSSTTQSYKNRLIRIKVLIETLQVL